jgi:hypothetical protein
MWRTFFESNSGSYAGRMFPPGMPKTTSTSRASSERTRDDAPVIRSATALAREPAGTTPSGVTAAGAAGPAPGEAPGEVPGEVPGVELPATAAEARWARTSGVGLVITMLPSYSIVAKIAGRELLEEHCWEIGLQGQQKTPRARHEGLARRRQGPAR